VGLFLFSQSVADLFLIDDDVVCLLVALVAVVAAVNNKNPNALRFAARKRRSTLRALQRGKVPAVERVVKRS
jgi:hypothetical protein